MASSLEFVEFVCDQVRNAGEIKYKKMFGEYGIYLNGKFVAAVCERWLNYEESNGQSTDHGTDHSTDHSDDQNLDADTDCLSIDCL